MSGRPVLIIGGDSKIGRALRESLRSAGQEVVSTSRRPGTQNHLYLDISDPRAWAPPARTEVAVLTASVTDQDLCSRMPGAMHRVNVEGVEEVVRRLHGRGIFVIYLSSNAVFDGATLYPDEVNTVPAPLGEYGRQKLAAEAVVQRLAGASAIVRLTKVLPPVFPLFRQWLRDLGEGWTIEPFSDLGIAPIPLDCCINVLRLLIEKRREGIWHVSGSRDISYEEIAHRAGAMVGAKLEQVKPVAARAYGRIGEHHCLRTALGTRRLREELGIVPPPVECTVDGTLRATWADLNAARTAA